MATVTEPKPRMPEEPNVIPDDELGERQDEEQAEAAQRLGGGGAPGTGQPDSEIPLALGEGVTEDQIEKAEAP